MNNDYILLDIKIIIAKSEKEVNNIFEKASILEASIREEAYLKIKEVLEKKNI